MNSNSDIKQESVKRAEPSSSSLSKRPLWQQRGAPSPAHTVPLAPKPMHHFWIAVISNWWMFSEWSGPRGPQPAAQVTGSSTQRRLFLCSWRSIILLSSCSPESRSWIPQPLPAHSSCLLAYSSVGCVCVCTCMHACSHVLVAGLRRAADCHPGVMPGPLQSTLLPSFGLMNGQPPYQSLYLQSQVVPWSPIPPAALVALSSTCSACFLYIHSTDPANRSAELHADDTILHVQFK